MAGNSTDEGRETFPRDRETPVTPVPDRGGPPPGFLELVYGVLFEPAATFSRIKERLPFGGTVLIFTLVNVAVSLLSATVTSRLMYFHALGGGMMMMKPFFPLLAAGGLLFQYGKWFAYSALLHLLAEFFGGKGRARQVWVVSGLACLPAVFTVPANVLLLLFGVGGFTLSLLVYLFSLVALVWGAFLLVIGIREVHALSTGRSVAVVLLPAAAVLAAALLLLVLLGVFAAVLTPFLHVPKIGS
ncbi:MAG: Yip1 family protein [Desulfotomaculales bacterium]